MTQPLPLSRRQTLRDYVDSFPRHVRQYEIAAALQIRAERLSKLLAGDRPTKTEAERLSAVGIEVAA